MRSLLSYLGWAILPKVLYLSLFAQVPIQYRTAIADRDSWSQTSSRTSSMVLPFAPAIRVPSPALRGSRNTGDGSSLLSCLVTCSTRCTRPSTSFAEKETFTRSSASHRGLMNALSGHDSGAWPRSIIRIRRRWPRKTRRRMGILFT